MISAVLAHTCESDGFNDYSGRQNNPDSQFHVFLPKIHVLASQTCVHVTICSKWGSSNVNKEFDMGDYPDDQCRPKGFISERRRKRVRIREQM